MKSGVAAGHPATCEAGIEILEDGGSAADAAVAACLASCVAETVMTGLLGGGHAIYWDAGSKRARNLDCFVAVPSGTGAPMVELKVPFGEELVHYAIGAASCGVPGVAGRARRAVARARSPAVGAARRARAAPRPRRRADAAGARPLPRDARARADARRRRAHLRAGREAPARRRAAASSPGSCARSSCCATRASDSVYSGSIAEALLSLCAERGGVVTREDLASYRATWTRSRRSRVRRDALPHARRALGRARHARACCRRSHDVVALVDALAAPRGPRRRHDEPRHRRRRRQRVRADHEPRPRLGRLPPRPRPSAEQHARRGRPRSR